MNQPAPKPDTAYAPGHVKMHPDWPNDVTIVMRTHFQDSDSTGVMSWQSLHPTNGSLPKMHAQVGHWPDCPDLTITPVIEADETPVIEGGTEQPAINA